MIPAEKQLGDVAEIMTGMTGFAEKGNYRYKVVQPNSFSDTGAMGAVEMQQRGEEVSEKQLLSVGDILVKRLNPSFVHVVTLESVGMVASQNLLVVRPGTGIDPDYLGYLLEQRKVGAIWKLSRKRKQLLNEYMTENDRLVSLLASQIINGGGNRR